MHVKFQGQIYPLVYYITNTNNDFYIYNPETFKLDFLAKGENGSGTGMSWTSAEMLIVNNEGRLNHLRKMTYQGCEWEMLENETFSYVNELLSFIHKSIDLYHVRFTK